MGLRHSIDTQHAEARSGPQCGVAVLLPLLDDEDAQALQEAMDNPLIAGTTIARALEKEGHRMAPHTLQRHRRGMCTCER